jgi:hypothetical protein
MGRPDVIVAVLGLSLLAAGCADPSQQVMNKEDVLAASGFKFVPANTRDRQIAFAKLPPHKFVRQVRGDKVVYLYADPTICVCLYVGGQKAYGAYQARSFDKQLADEQASNAYFVSEWNWGPWAAGYPYGWPNVESVY